MARIIIVEGLSGTGKSTSWEHIPEKEAFVISPNGKPFPFRGAKKKYQPYNNETGTGNMIVTNKINEVGPSLNWLNANAPHVKYILIDDFTHFFSARTLSADFRAKSTGKDTFGRWADFGADVYSSVFELAPSMREDLTIVINHHTEMKDEGYVGFKTSGKLLDREVDPVSHVTYVFHSRVIPGENGNSSYVFMTNTDGQFQCKTPKGCFTEQFIPNDMFAAIKAIEAYENGDEPTPQQPAQ